MVYCGVAAKVLSLGKGLGLVERLRKETAQETAPMSTLSDKFIFCREGCRLKKSKRRNMAHYIKDTPKSGW